MYKFFDGFNFSSAKVTTFNFEPTFLVYGNFIIYTV